MKTKPAPLRLAFREEDGFWTCYVARLDTMKDAMPIGSILMRVVQEHVEVKDAFMHVMKQTFSIIIEEVTGAPPVNWSARPAPPHERKPQDQ